MESNCSMCDSPLGDDASTCGTCGAPTDARAASGQPAECNLCGSLLWSHAESCPSCGAQGYPALRPRWGDKSLGEPDAEERGA